MNKLAVVAKQVGFQIKKHSPEILTGLGIIAGAAAAVVACKETLAIDKIMEEHNENIKKIKEYKTDEDVYPEKIKRQDICKVYGRTCLAFAKNYAPAVSLGIVSVTCILAGQKVMKSRNAALAAAYTVLDQSFKDYRKRVVERFGESVDEQLLYNMTMDEMEFTTIDGKGKEKTEKEVVEIADPNVSGYMRYFTRSNPNWENDEAYILNFIKAQESVANNLLIATKNVVLNDIYKSLGFKTSKAGMVVGWVYDEKNPSGDNFVEFKVTPVMLPNEFTGVPEKAYAIDFNVDGNIYDKMPG